MSEPINASPDIFLPSGATSRVGQYELLTPLGKGGMAYVYLARKMGSGGFERLVAIKVMHRNIAADEDFVQMFLDEARLAALIHHPNVVPILDLGNDNGQLYMVMDYIEGDTLAAIQRTAIGLARAIPLGISLRIVLDALIGLDAAHNLHGPDGESLQLIHRDVSPQNILVGSDGAARLVDFGIARAERRLSLTSIGMLKGKAPFMAPEQLEGGVVDRRADVFSMGVTLWETLALRRCFPARSRPDLLHESLRAPYRSMLMFTDQIPEVLDGLCEKALAYDPEERYASAAAFADAIEANFRADIATQRQVGQFMTAVVAEKIGREREAVRKASASATTSVAPGSRVTTDPGSVFGKVDPGMKPTAPQPGGGLRHHKDSIGVLELRAPTLPPSLELQTSFGSGSHIAATQAPIRTLAHSSVGDSARLRPNDHELSDQPTRVKQSQQVSVVRPISPLPGSTHVSGMSPSDSMLGAPELPDLEATTSFGIPRFAHDGSSHPGAPTMGAPAQSYAAPQRIAATKESEHSRPHLQSRPGTARAPRLRLETLAAIRVPPQLSRAKSEHVERAAAGPNAMQEPAPTGTPREVPLGLRTSPLTGGRPNEPQISTDPVEIEEHATELSQDELVESEARWDAPAGALRSDQNADVAALRSPTPTGDRTRPEISSADQWSQRPVAMPLAGASPDVADADLERHRVRPQAFVEPPTGLPVFARVVIALVLFALSSLAGWQMMQQ